MTSRRHETIVLVLKLLAIVLFIAGMVLSHTASSATPSGTSSTAAAIDIPERSARFRIALERAAGAQYGLDAPVARLAAQIHQESRWRPDAESEYAEGISQITPATAAWLATICPDVGDPDTWNPAWSIRAQVCYDAWLYERINAANECERWAMTLSAYNGGLGWVYRDKKRAAGAGADPLRWFAHVELHTGRAAWARAENRDYVRRILLVLEPVYAAAGWSGEAVCP